MATQVFRNSAEGYTTDPTTVTQGVGGNSGGGSGDFWDIVTTSGSNTAQATAAAKKHGTRGYSLSRVGGSTSQLNLQKTFAADVTDFVLKAWYQIPTQPGTDHQFFKGYSDAGGTTVSWAILISGTGKLKVAAGSASTVIYTGTTETIPAGTWVRCEAEFVSATSARVIMYAGDSMTVLADSGLITTGTSVIGATRTLRVGLLTTTAAPTNIQLDDVTGGSGPGLFGLDTTGNPSSLVSNPGAWVAVGAASIPLALSTATISAGYAESPAAGSAVEFTVGYPDKVFQEGALSVDVETFLDTSTPFWDLTLTAFLNGVSVGTRAVVANTTVVGGTTWVLSGLTGDMSSLQIKVSGTTQ